ncbi:MAG: sulfatase-like hydrolase/transferase, partial [Oxalobacter sp.]
FWISSQGYVGKHEVGASSIATSADHIIVTNDIKEDFSLLPLIQSSLNSNDKRKLLIVHLWGQHEAPWKHLDGIGVVFNTGKGKFIDSYFSSIKKTDVFLQRMTDMIRSTGKKFKVVFFPDHALNFIQDGDGYIQYRDADIKQTYEIPFIAFGSDIKTTERINITQSAYNFTSYFPTWIGVETNLTPKGFDIFTESCTSPKIVKYGEIPASFSSLKDGLKIKDILQAW